MSNLEKEFVPYKESLALKELGFDEDCYGFYDEMDNNQPKGGSYPCNGLNSAPLYQQAFRWFRENHGLVSEIQAPDGSKGKWNPTIHKAYGFGNHYDNDGFNTYKEAELACLRKLIEIVNESKKENV